MLMRMACHLLIAVSLSSIQRTLFGLNLISYIRGQIIYPLSTGRNFDEIVRLLDSLILYDLRKVATPSKWQPGGEILMLNSTTDEEAQKRFKGFRKVRPFYRVAKVDGDPKS